MIDELNCTAWHEAGHVVALWQFGVPISSVAVRTVDSGETDFDETSWKKLPDKNAVLVALVGMMAESEVNDDYSVDSAIGILLGASADRGIIYKDFLVYWEHLGNIGRQSAYNKAQILIDDYQIELNNIASALIAKPGFPKVLNADEIKVILNGLTQ